ncbi:hypothetical protein DFH07DRAFT_964748 [Mycena maculata]|uniref:Uncharacterized protein n=1 Tax=Mycena maculata TaxID=230809 RepID=A0AAD7N1S1_9AGAR|nr:hypothetical protein DFH07DRAFT_964748 [Mycena maculata]
MRFQTRLPGLTIVILGFPLVASPTTIPYVASAIATEPPPSASVTPAATESASAVTAPTPPAPTARVPAGSGLPAPLVALLRTTGPYLANEVYSVVPAEPLGPIKEDVAAPECKLSLRVASSASSINFAISGVAHAARKVYTTQGLALDAFNQALTWGGVQVV